ncbi:CPBP family intramembrane metalloprotease [Enterococcus durans]|uniref:CPBP family intramembrane glutamic endopeptidase n=1 Tax=Enterococcus TaxID=1350 RepID=UPI000CF1BEAC|nr:MULTISPECIES: CPBP family intramembrane glutamic endopeptidase [Enterococcus]PQD35733.1 CPBP family intramembrane metalloprotease [Enterococcus durans]QED60027.1 CPBP family intramembrane metalloprotease [Enterococcus durans]QED62391.1 CPBP family intramembrane metalloprotease [Enterococcus durans]ROX85292.1 CPBP family intramembrane metalloprotease [Enterococcus durans]TKN16029.1 CPBP family intramembrane metalloprotease [Enterococcus sp. VV15]
MERKKQLLILYIFLLIMIPRLCLLPLATFLAIDYDTLNEWYFFIVTSLLALLAVYLYWPKLKSDWQRKKQTGISFIFTGFIGFLMIFLFTFLSFMFFHQGSLEKSANQTNLENLSHPLIAHLMPLCVVFFGPLLEELLFRGYVFSEMKRKCSTFPAFLCSVLLFTLIHLNNLQEIRSLLPYFSIGVITTLSYSRKNENIYYPLSIHIMNNLIAQILIWSQ